MNLSATDVIESMMFIVSLSVFLQKPVPLYLKLFPIYFISALAVAIYIEYTSSHGIYNTAVPNAYGTFEFCFYFFVLREVIVNVKAKRAILFVIFSFALFAFINLIFIQKKIGYNPVNFTVGSLLSVIICIYYFVELFQKVDAPALARLPAFWIASAILFNTVLTFPMFAFVSFMEDSKLIFDNIGAIFNIIIVLTSILYSIGFLCRIRISKSTL